MRPDVGPTRATGIRDDRVLPAPTAQRDPPELVHIQHGTMRTVRSTGARPSMLLVQALDRPVEQSPE